MQLKIRDLGSEVAREILAKAAFEEKMKADGRLGKYYYCDTTLNRLCVEASAMIAFSHEREELLRRFAEGAIRAAQEQALMRAGTQALSPDEARPEA